MAYLFPPDSTWSHLNLKPSQPSASGGYKYIYICVTYKLQVLGVKKQFTSVRNDKGCLCSPCAALHPLQSLCEYKVMRWYMRWRKGCANRAWDGCRRGGKALVQCAEGWRFARLNAKVSLSVIEKPQTNACVNDPCLWWRVWMGVWRASKLLRRELLLACSAWRI